MSSNGKATSLPNAWKNVRLGEITTFINGDRGKNYPSQGAFVEEGIPFINAGHLQQGQIDFASMNYIPESHYDLLGSGKTQQNDILYCLRGSLGKSAIVRTCNKGAIASSLVIIRPSDECYVDYIFRYLDSPFGRKEIQRFDNGSAQPNLSAQSVKDYRIPLPPLSEQKRIAGILDKADSIRRKRQQAIGLTEQFLRSTFLDMFGDPVTNVAQFPKVSLRDVAAGDDGVKCGPFGTQLAKSEFQHEGIPLWGIKHVNKHFKKSTVEFLTEQKAEELDSYSLLPFDLVMTRKGTVGNCAIYPRDFPRGIMHSDLLRVRLNTEKCTPHFMSWQLSISQDVAHQISLLSHGAIMAGINVTKLKSISVLVPPLKLQEQFEAVLERHQNAMRKQTNTMHESDNLFNSLVQRAFRGEL